MRNLLLRAFWITCILLFGAKAIAVATGTHPREELAEFQPDLLLDDLAAHHEVLAMLFAQ